MLRMKFRFPALAVCALFLSTGIALQAQTGYSASVDLGTLENDRLEIFVRLPEIPDKQASFIFPRVVPGTYDRSDYGRFVEGFQAISERGKPCASSGPT